MIRFMICFLMRHCVDTQVMLGLAGSLFRYVWNLSFDMMLFCSSCRKHTLAFPKMMITLQLLLYPDGAVTATTS